MWVITIITKSKQILILFLKAIHGNRKNNDYPQIVVLKVWVEFFIFFDSSGV
jgi:hypothetical protein